MNKYWIEEARAIVSRSQSFAVITFVASSFYYCVINKYLFPPTTSKYRIIFNNATTINHNFIYFFNPLS